MICALSHNQTFISDLVASKSLSNASYNIQFKHEFYMRSWRYSVNASLMKQVKQLPAQKMGIDHLALFGTELNMGYVQGFAKRKLSSRIYAGLGLEWSFVAKYQIAYSDMEGSG